MGPIYTLTWFPSLILFSGMFISVKIVLPTKYKEYVAEHMHNAMKIVNNIRIEQKQVIDQMDQKFDASQKIG